MALLDVPSTRSSLLALRRQLLFAEEGYDLLDRKRELLLLELEAAKAAAAKRSAESGAAVGAAFSSLRAALLDGGSAAVDRAALGAAPEGRVTAGERKLMGVKVPSAAFSGPPPSAAFGPLSAPAAAAEAGGRFAGALPGLAELAALQTAVFRLSRELRKTQRRCNALSKKLIPDCRETITFLAAALEEREREGFVILKMVRDRLAAG